MDFVGNVVCVNCETQLEKPVQGRRCHCGPGLQFWELVDIDPVDGTVYVKPMDHLPDLPELPELAPLEPLPDLTAY